jgi:adenine-specific DNA-methyltransferase
LLKCGVRGKSCQMITFSRVEPLPGTRWLHADAETIRNVVGVDNVHEPGPAASQRSAWSSLSGRSTRRWSSAR